MFLKSLHKVNILIKNNPNILQILIIETIKIKYI